MSEEDVNRIVEKAKQLPTDQLKEFSAVIIERIANMSDDITQDPEYQAGYKMGIEQYKYNQSLHRKGYLDGLKALEYPQTVESKASPIQHTHMEEYVTRAEFEEFKKEMNERLQKLEKYTQE
jgi:hypothetical protein